ncbi:MAG: hypothetical protein EBQ92_05890 [Proteobacteria bacterium]|nr:hypothetical protein [Pseudomonadota bacterium]
MRFLFLVLLVGLSIPIWGQTTVISEWGVNPGTKITLETPQQRTQPIVVGDLLFTADISGNVTAYHRIFGYVLWKTKVEGGVDGAFSYGRSKLFVGDLKGNLYALNSRDGSESWRFKIQSEWLAPPAIYRDKVVAMSSNDEVYALSETKGSEIWHYSHRGDEKMTIRGTAGPTIYGDQVFIGFSDGNLAALRLKDGNENWVKRLKSRERFYDVDTTPVVDDGGVVAASFDGKAYSLDLFSGSIQWTFPAGAYSSPLIIENRVYLAGLDGYVYALDRQTSAVVWKSERFEGVALAPTQVGNTLVITTSSDPVLILDIKTGKTLMKENLGAGTLTPATGAPDGWFYCFSNYNNLTAFRIFDFLEKKGPETVSSPTAVIRDLGNSKYDKNHS